MKIKIEQLPQHLKGTIQHCWLISGDEPLFTQEATDLIRKEARQQRFIERYSYQIDAKFDWDQLNQHSDNFSLFSEKQLIELHFTSKPNKVAKETLNDLLEKQSPDHFLLITSSKLDGTQTKAAWHKLIEKKGVVVNTWPPSISQLSSWLTQRLKAKDFTVEPEALRYLAACVEGNLLAAKQSIERAQLLFEPKTLTLDDIQEVINQSAQYDVFTLSDSLLTGNSKRCVTIINELRHNTNELTLALWSISKEIRTLLKLKAGENVYIWDSKKTLYQQAQQRIEKKQLEQSLQTANQIDQIIKGQIKGNAWNSITLLCLSLCNHTSVPVISTKMGIL